MHRLVNFGQEMLEAGRREEREALQQTIEQLLREQIQRQDAHHNYVDNHHEGMCDMANKCLDAIEGQK
jgi:predicted nucleic-acid-binding protein